MIDFETAGWREKAKEWEEDGDQLIELSDLKYYDRAGRDETYVLPHSCDGWVLGDLDDLRAMRADLDRVIAAAEGRT